MDGRFTLQQNQGCFRRLETSLAKTFMLCIMHAMHAASVVFMAERLNGLGAKHWKRFSGQDYFDPRGVFFTTLVSGPLVIIMLIVLVSSCSKTVISHL